MYESIFFFLETTKIIDEIIFGILYFLANMGLVYWARVRRPRTHPNSPWPSYPSLHILSMCFSLYLYLVVPIQPFVRASERSETATPAASLQLRQRQRCLPPAKAFRRGHSSFLRQASPPPSGEPPPASAVIARPRRPRWCRKASTCQRGPARPATSCPLSSHYAPATNTGPSPLQPQGATTAGRPFSPAHRWSAAFGHPLNLIPSSSSPAPPSSLAPPNP